MKVTPFPLRCGYNRIQTGVVVVLDEFLDTLTCSKKTIVHYVPTVPRTLLVLVLVNLIYFFILSILAEHYLQMHFLKIICVASRCLHLNDQSDAPKH